MEVREQYSISLDQRKHAADKLGWFVLARTPAKLA